MLQVFLVFAGGGAGALGRYWIGAMALRQFGPGFPVGTLLVNILGSLAMGVLVGWLVQRDIAGSGTSSDLRLLLATGFLGGFTTFSAFSLDFATMWQRGDAMAAIFYAAISVLASLAAIFLGLWLTRAVAA